MARTSAITNGPVLFTDSDGRYVALPPSALYFENGVLHAAGPEYDAHKKDADVWLAFLQSSGEARPGPPAPVVPAVRLTAVRPGPAGNGITVTVTDPRPDPVDSKKSVFDASVVQSDPPRTVAADATLGDTLGTSATSGAAPGLVFLSSTGAPKTPKAGTYTADDAGVVKVAAASGSAAAFELTFRGTPDKDAERTVTIGEPAADGFTLAARWRKTVTGLHVDALGAAAGFGALIAAEDPAGGTPKATPEAGTVVLRGGAEARQATKAEAIVPATS
jgi:hypothetical protein